jgi:hypothetical protein
MMVLLIMSRAPVARKARWPAEPLVPAGFTAGAEHRLAR